MVVTIMKLSTTLLATGLASSALGYAVGGKPKHLIQPYKRQALQDIVRSSLEAYSENRLC